MLREGIADTYHYVPQSHKEFIHAELRIVQIRGRSAYSKPAIIHVDKISVNNLIFRSPLVFPVLPRMMYKLQLTIMNETIELAGSISRCRLKDYYHLYEMSYTLTEPAKAKLFEQLSELSRLSMPLLLKADYYYRYFAETTYRFQTNRINILL
jgi:hypothetical protein